MFGLLESHMLLPRLSCVNRGSRAFGPSTIARDGLGEPFRSAKGATSRSAAHQGRVRTRLGASIKGFEIYGIESVCHKQYIQENYLRGSQW